MSFFSFRLRTKSLAVICICVWVALCTAAARGEAEEQSRLGFSAAVLSWQPNIDSGFVFVFVKNRSERDVKIFTRPTIAGLPVCFRLPWRLSPILEGTPEHLPDAIVNDDYNAIPILYDGNLDIMDNVPHWWQSLLPELRASDYVMPQAVIAPMVLHPGETTLLSRRYSSGGSELFDPRKIRVIYSVSPSLARQAQAWEGSVVIVPSLFLDRDTLKQTGIMEPWGRFFPDFFRWPRPDLLIERQGSDKSELNPE